MDHGPNRAGDIVNRFPQAQEIHTNPDRGTFDMIHLKRRQEMKDFFTLIEREPFGKIFVDRPKPFYIKGYGMVVRNGDITAWLVSHYEELQEIADGYLSLKQEGCLELP